MLVHSRFVSTIDLTGPIINIVHHVVLEFMTKIGFPRCKMGYLLQENGASFCPQVRIGRVFGALTHHNPLLP